jgi:hypothetical protein
MRLMFDDPTARYLPERLICSTHMHKPAVVRAEAFPAGSAPAKAPIVKECVAVAATLECGVVRWFGCDSAHIDSSLRMVLVGHFSRDEVRQT